MQPSEHGVPRAQAAPSPADTSFASPADAALATRADAWRASVIAAIGLAFLLALPALSSGGTTGTEAVSSTEALPGPSTWQWWAALVALLTQSVVLLRATRSPSLVLVLTTALAFVSQATPIGATAQVTYLPIVLAAYVAACVTALRVPSGRDPASDPRSAARTRLPTGTATALSPAPWTAAALLTWGASVGAGLRGADAGIGLVLGGSVVQAAVVLGIPAAVGVTVGTRAAVRGARERELLARADEQEARMEAALAEERTAIARELHDIAAHHLSGIAVMASAISQQIDADPEQAKASLADVRSQTRTLLDELRGLVALLRHDEDASVSVETLPALESLVAQARDRGMEVTLALPDGASLTTLSRGLGPLSQFAAYRTVQEALANAIRHAPGAPCTVTLTDAGRAVEIEVINGPGNRPTASGEPGFGLRGMQERASLTKATLQYGPLDDGGWRVNLRLPREQSAESTEDAP